MFKGKDSALLVFRHKTGRFFDMRSDEIGLTPNFKAHQHAQAGAAGKPNSNTGEVTCRRR
jgi:hypothetical protein